MFTRNDFFRLSLLMVAIVTSVFVVSSAKAEESLKVDYEGKTVIDWDSDGLTDEGEIQVFGTDPKESDTDGDLFFDGVEILNGSDPLDESSRPGVAQDKNRETPWTWFFGRASGLVAFLCMWVSLMIAQSIRNPWMRRWIAPAYKLDLHIYFAIAAFLLGAFHGVAFILDRYTNLSILEFFIPFYADSGVVNTIFLGFGILALYGFLIVGTIAMFRRFLPYKVFRISHFLNIPVAILVYWHAVKIGTDLKVGWVFWIFLSMNLLLAAFWIRTLAAMYATFRTASAIGRTDETRNTQT